MKPTWKSWSLLGAACVALLLAACDSRPFEKAGKAVDRAGDKAGDAIRDIVK